MKIDRLNLFLFLCIFFSSIATHADTAAELTLKDCGAVIGHEMGLWEFFSYPPGPHQVDRVVKSKLNFVKISLQKLKDGVWVVNHDPEVTIYPESANSVRIRLDQITSTEVENLKKISDAKIPIYRLDEYLQRDEGKLCWMLTTKVQPDQSLVKLILDLGIQERIVFLTKDLSDVKFYSSFPEENRLHFAGRVGNDPAELQVYSPYIERLWAMEIDPTPNAKNMIDAVHQLGLKAYLDSMRFSKTYEFFGTACKKVFQMGADYTQTNRPLECIKEKAFSF